MKICYRLFTYVMKICYRLFTSLHNPTELNWLLVESESLTKYCERTTTSYHIHLTFQVELTSKVITM
jgi:hypothetical protein